MEPRLGWRFLSCVNGINKTCTSFTKPHILLTCICFLYLVFFCYLIHINLSVRMYVYACLRFMLIIHAYLYIFKCSINSIVKLKESDLSKTCISSNGNKKDSLFYQIYPFFLRPNRYLQRIGWWFVCHEEEKSWEKIWKVFLKK